METMKKYKQETTKGTTESNKQLDYESEETSELNGKILSKWRQRRLVRWLVIKKGRRGMIGITKSVK